MDAAGREIKWREREREGGKGKRKNMGWRKRKGKYPRCRDSESVVYGQDITVTGRRSWRRETRAMPGELYMIQKHNHLPLDLPNSAENRPSASNRPCGCRYPTWPSHLTASDPSSNCFFGNTLFPLLSDSLFPEMEIGEPCQITVDTLIRRNGTREDRCCIRKFTEINRIRNRGIGVKSLEQFFFFLYIYIFESNSLWKRFRNFESDLNWVGTVGCLLFRDDIRENEARETIVSMTIVSPCYRENI